MQTAPFCDFLSVTFGREENPRDDVEAFLLGLGAVPIDGQLWRLGLGTIQLRVFPTVWYASFSGACIDHLRAQGQLLSLLGLLAAFPHRVTRLDASLDVAVYAPAVLAALRRRYRHKKVSLGRKPQGVTLMLARRESDGKETGTFYVGHRTRSRCTARVYDKQAERLARTGQSIPPTTRYEVTVKTDYGATLRDAAEPERLFWHVAGETLLPRPPDVHAWSGAWAEGFFTVKPEGRPLAVVLGRRIDDSAELEVLERLADKLGPNGRRFIARRILERLGFGRRDALLEDELLHVPPEDRRPSAKTA